MSGADARGGRAVAGAVDKSGGSVRWPGGGPRTLQIDRPTAAAPATPSHTSRAAVCAPPSPAPAAAAASSSRQALSAVAGGLGAELIGTEEGELLGAAMLRHAVGVLYVKPELGRLCADPLGELERRRARCGTGGDGSRGGRRRPRPGAVAVA